MLKKLLLIIFMGVIPAQSMALNYNQKMGLACFGVYAGLIGAVLGGCYYWDKHKEIVERAFWNNKSDEEIRELVTKFVNKIERHLATQLKKLRANGLKSSYTIKSNLKCFYFIRKTIIKSDSWLKRLENRDIRLIAEQMQTLKTELVQLLDVLEIYIDKDLIELYEKSKNQQNTVFIPFAVPYVYSY